MVDLHHHLLFGLDDGSPDLKTSVAMAKMAVADGITHIVCTPHASGSYAFDPAQITERIAVLRDALTADSVPLTLGTGCDFHLSYDNIQDALAHPRKYAINGGSFLLVELPDFGLPQTLTDAFYQMQLVGLTPILTHPERNPTLQRDPKRLIEWLRNGLLIQVTSSSILGQMGKEAERMSHRLLADRWVHFVSTDAHNLTTRPPRMSAACDAVASKYGTDYAHALCTENPSNVFKNSSLNIRDEPRNLFNESEPTPPWWKRLFRKKDDE